MTSKQELLIIQFLKNTLKTATKQEINNFVQKNQLSEINDPLFLQKITNEIIFIEQEYFKIQFLLEILNQLSLKNQKNIDVFIEEIVFYAESVVSQKKKFEMLERLVLDFWGDDKFVDTDCKLELLINLYWSGGFC